MTVEELADKYISEAPEYNMDVQFFKEEDTIGLIHIRIRGRDEYYVNMWMMNGKLYIRLVRRYFDGVEEFRSVINDEQCRPLSDDEPEFSLKYVREFITRSVEGAGIHWYEDKEISE